MRGLWNSKLLFWNFVALAVIKAGLVPLAGMASLIEGVETFSAQAIINETNSARTAQGRASLAESFVLNVAAAQKLDDMVRHQYFAHVSPQGVSPWYWFKNNGYSYTYAGENLAIGYPDAAMTVQAWLRSPSHRNNLLSPWFKEIGVATARVTIAGDTGTLVVQLFGAPAVAGDTSTSTPTFSFSQSSAEEPTVTPQVTATPRTEPLRLTPLPSQSVAIASPGPKTSSIQQVPTWSRIVNILNSTFASYAYLTALACLGYILLREVRRELVLKTALHIALFLLAVYLPMLTASTMAGSIR